LNKIGLEKTAAFSPGVFRVSKRPIVSAKKPKPISETSASAADDFDNLGELPRSYETESIYLIARDSKTLFTYWDIDWTTVFEQLAPRTLGIHLRVLKPDGAQESVTKIDPIAGNWYLPVAQAGALYQVEIGYFRSGENWAAVARSGFAATPADKVSHDTTADFATLPFHLSFQRLLALFRLVGADGGTLLESLARLQQKARALSESMSAPEWLELLGLASGSAERDAILQKTGLTSADLDALLQPSVDQPMTIGLGNDLLERWLQTDGGVFDSSSSAWGRSAASCGAYGSSLNHRRDTLP
jgi:hypothetical protein